MLLILILIVLLCSLILFQLYGAFIRLLKYLRLRMREGLENMSDSKSNSNNLTYTDPGLNKDALYLSTVNAANITYLKEQVDKLSDLKQQVKALNERIDTNSTATSAIGEQLTLTSQEIIGKDASNKEPLPMVTGLA
jgi:hypothetical protein